MPNPCLAFRTLSKKKKIPTVNAHDKKKKATYLIYIYIKERKKEKKRKKKRRHTTHTKTLGAF